MYKRITHSIVEEHFGHPMASEIKESLDNKSVTLRYFIEPMTIDKFRSDIFNYYNSLTSKLNSAVKAIESGNETQLMETEKTVFENIDQVGNLFKGLYGLEFGERFNQFNRSFVLGALSIAKNLKNKVDIRDWRNRLDVFKFDLANMLFTNNNLWRQPDTQNLLGQIIDALVQHEQAVINKDSAGETQTKEKLVNLWSSLASTLAFGAAQQHPAKFTN
jgi:hypothetical protein